jgi:5'-nucleotidase
MTCYRSFYFVSGVRGVTVAQFLQLVSPSTFRNSWTAGSPVVYPEKSQQPLFRKSIPLIFASTGSSGAIRMRSSRILLTLVVTITCAASGCSQPTRPVADAADAVELKILAINDFHGNLEARRGDLGGAAYLATHLRQAEAAAQHTAIVSAGDLIGATPLISSLFHDEPTIETANLWGLDFNAVGNHELDEGSDELLRMQYGGPHPVDGESAAGPFNGAEFLFLAANVIDDETGETLLPPYAIEYYEGIPVAFIGLTLKGTPTVSTPAAVEGLSFTGEVETINEYVDELKGLGVEAIVVIIHEGGYPANGAEDDCNDLSGPIVGIVERTDPAVDLFVTGHTHRQYLCRLNGRPVTSTGTAGRFFTDITTSLDRWSGDMTVLHFDNVPVTQDVEAAPDVEALIARYRSFVETVSLSIVGRITGDFTKDQNEAGESLLGGLIADAQLAATASRQEGGAEVAFMNSGGIRSNLLFEATGEEKDGEVTYGEVFAVHPFGNRLVTMTLSGAQIHQLLEQQWADRPTPNILTPSEGFSYTWQKRAAAGSKVSPSSIRIDGVVVDHSRSYRVTVNDFLAGGGDGFALFLDGTHRVDGIADVDALERYLQTNSPLGPVDLNRIRLSSNSD